MIGPTVIGLFFPPIVVIQFVTRQIALTSIAYIDQRLYALHVAQSLDQSLVLLLRLTRVPIKRRLQILK